MRTASPRASGEFPRSHERGPIEAYYVIRDSDDRAILISALARARPH